MAQSVLERHASAIAGSVSCFDRVIFRGYLKHLSHPCGMMQFMASQDALLRDFDRFVRKHTDRIVASTKDMCRQRGRSYTYLNSYHIDKDAMAREIAASQGIGEGLVCCLSVVERTNTFRLGRFRNGSVAQALYGPTDEPVLKRRHAARAARRIRKLHLRGYVARIPRTRAWAVTAKGYAVLGACVRAYHDDIPQLIQNQREAS